MDAIPGIDLALTSEFDSPRLHQFNPFRATQPGVSADCPTLLLDRCLRVNYLRLRQRNRLLQTDSDDTLPSLAQTWKEGCCERGSILRLANRKVGPSKQGVAGSNPVPRSKHTHSPFNKARRNRPVGLYFCARDALPFSGAFRPETAVRYPPVNQQEKGQRLMLEPIAQSRRSETMELSDTSLEIPVQMFRVFQ